MGHSELEDRVAASVALIRKAERLALEYDPVNGFALAFSGGKDSQCLYHLAVEAGVRFHAHMSLTSIDPPEVIRFVRKNYPDVELIKPKKSIFSLAKEKHLLPTMTRRWCCAEYKEMHGAGRVTLLGVRREESSRRRRRKEVETAHRDRDRRFGGDWADFERYRETAVACVGGRDAVLVSPMLEWTERDVWAYLRERGIPHCRLYDEGYRRIGCVMCPMQTARATRRDMERYPHIAEKWMEVIQYLVDNGFAANGKIRTARMGLEWWVSKKPFEKFYADEYQQQKIDFTTKQETWD